MLPFLSGAEHCIARNCNAVLDRCFACGSLREAASALIQSLHESVLMTRPLFESGLMLACKALRMI